MTNQDIRTVGLLGCSKDSTTFSTILSNAAAVSPSGSAKIRCTPSSPPLTIPGSKGREPRNGTERFSAASKPPPLLKTSSIIDHFPSESETVCSILPLGPLIEISVSGGTPEYTVTIDGNQETTQNDGLFLFENLGPGAYEIQINDLNGCLITETVYINSPEPIEIDPNIINPLSG